MVKCHFQNIILLLSITSTVYCLSCVWLHVSVRVFCKEALFYFNVFKLAMFIVVVWNTKFLPLVAWVL